MNDSRYVYIYIYFIFFSTFSVFISSSVSSTLSPELSSNPLCGESKIQDAPSIYEVIVPRGEQHFSFLKLNNEKDYGSP